jgi:hypothetical protein
MMRRIKAICLMVLMLAVQINCRKPANNNPLTEDMFKVTVEKQFVTAKQRVESLQLSNLFTPPLDASPILFAQNEEGNAGELYWAALKDRVDPNAEPTKQLLSKTTPLIQVFELALRENLELTPKTIEAVKKDAAEAVAIPELSNFESGAKRKNSRLIGEVIPIADNLLGQQLVPFPALNGYMAAMMAKGLTKEGAGDKTGAESAMQTIVAVGQHLVQDPAFPHYNAGALMMKFGCAGLRSFYKRNNNTDKLQAAEKLDAAIDEQLAKLAQLNARDELGQNFNILRSLGYLDDGIEPLIKIASDEKLPAAARAGAIESLFMGYVFRYLMVERSGRPAESSEYAPPSEARIKAFERLSALPDKSLSQMAGKGGQILSKMKGLNSGERMKYWRELSAKSA